MGDEVQKERIAAKNGLESYCFNMKAINDKCDEAIKWLDGNQLGEKDEFVDKQKEVEAVCSPIVTKLYQGAGGAPGGMPGAGTGATGWEMDPLLRRWTESEADPVSG